MKIPSILPYPSRRVTQPFGSQGGLAQSDRTCGASRFREMPTLAQLGQQHELLQQRFAEIVASTQDLDLRMQFVRIIETPFNGARII